MVQKRQKVYILSFQLIHTRHIMYLRNTICYHEDTDREGHDSYYILYSRVGV